MTMTITSAGLVVNSYGQSWDKKRWLLNYLCTKLLAHPKLLYKAPTLLHRKSFSNHKSQQVRNSQFRGNQNQDQPLSLSLTCLLLDVLSPDAVGRHWRVGAPAEQQAAIDQVGTVLPEVGGQVWQVDVETLGESFDWLDTCKLPPISSRQLGAIIALMLENANWFFPQEV